MGRYDGNNIEEVAARTMALFYLSAISSFVFYQYGFSLSMIVIKTNFFAWKKEYFVSYVIKYFPILFFLIGLMIFTL